MKLLAVVVVVAVKYYYTILNTMASPMLPSSMANLETQGYHTGGQSQIESRKKKNKIRAFLKQGQSPLSYPYDIQIRP